MIETILNYYVHTMFFCLIYLSVLIFAEDKLDKKDQLSREECVLSVLIALIPFVNTLQAVLYIMHALFFLFKKFINLFKQNK